MGKAAGGAVIFLGVITMFFGLLFAYVGMVTWAIVAGQYFMMALFLFIITGFLFWKGSKMAKAKKVYNF